MSYYRLAISPDLKRPTTLCSFPAVETPNTSQMPCFVRFRGGNAREEAPMISVIVMHALRPWRDVSPTPAGFFALLANDFQTQGPIHAAAYIGSLIHFTLEAQWWIFHPGSAGNRAADGPMLHHWHIDKASAQSRCAGSDKPESGQRNPFQSYESPISGSRESKLFSYCTKGFPTSAMAVVIVVELVIIIAQCLPAR
jgi:hypothetical protein